MPFYCIRTLLFMLVKEKDYCDYDTCFALKELGYVGSSRYYYTQRDHKFHYDAYNKFYTVRTADAIGYVLAIHLYDAQKWLREVKKLHITIHSQSQESWQYRITKPHQKLEDGLHGEDFSSFEEALSEGIKEAIKYIEII